MMIRITTVGLMLQMLCAMAIAQAPTPSRLPADLARLPEAIRTLPWRQVDLEKVDLLEECRALFILNHVLGELAPIRASDADLMSAYIDQRNLGASLASTGQPPYTPPLTFADGMKISVAILRGPLADSSYSREFTNSTRSTLLSYQRMYQSTCQRRWAELAESAEEVQYMGAFLKRTGYLADFQTWAKAESANRQHDYETDMAKKQVVQAAKEDAAAQQAAAAIQAQRQKEDEQLRDAMLAAQSEQPLPAQQDQAEPPAWDDYYGYPAWYGSAYYRGSSGAWYGDPSYVGGARASTETRMANWSSAAGRRR